MSLRRCARISSDKYTARALISPLLETSLIIPILDSFLYFSQEKAIFCDDFLLRFPAGRAIMETVAQLVYGRFPLLRRTRWAALFYLSITSDIFFAPPSFWRGEAVRTNGSNAPFPRRSGGRESRGTSPSGAAPRRGRPPRRRMKYFRFYEQNRSKQWERTGCMAGVPLMSWKTEVRVPIVCPVSNQRNLYRKYCRQTPHKTFVQRFVMA